MALVALVRLVVGVGEQVSLQVRPLIETPLTHRTLVRRLLLKTLLFSQILHSTKERQVEYSHLIKSIMKKKIRNLHMKDAMDCQSS